MRLFDYRGLCVRLAWTIDHERRFWRIDGRMFPLLVSRSLNGGRFAIGRGGVLLLGPLMVWWLHDIGVIEVAA